MAILSFKTATRARSRCSYWDLYIDDRRLAGELDIGDFIPPIGWLGPTMEEHFLAMLLLKIDGDLPGRRVPIFVCAECADYGCGVITCVVERTEQGIVWRDFGAQDDYSDGVRENESWSRFFYTFDAKQYEGVLEGHYQLAKKGR